MRRRTVMRRMSRNSRGRMGAIGQLERHDGPTHPRPPFCPSLPPSLLKRSPPWTSPGSKGTQSCRREASQRPSKGEERPGTSSKGINVGTTSQDSKGRALSRFGVRLPIENRKRRAARRAQAGKAR